MRVANLRKHQILQVRPVLLFYSLRFKQRVELCVGSHQILQVLFFVLFSLCCLFPFVPADNWVAVCVRFCFYVVDQHPHQLSGMQQLLRLACCRYMCLIVNRASFETVIIIHEQGTLRSAVM